MLPGAAVVLVLLAGGLASVALGRLDLERRASDERGRVAAELGTIRARLDGIIQSTFNSTDGLIDLVQLRHGIDQPLFDSMARLAIGKNRYIRNVTLAPDDRIAMVYPLKGNEKVLGFRYAAIPVQNEAVTRARQERRAILDGPVNLIQGGQGLINRSPIFIEDADGIRYWGTASVVAYVDSIFQASGVSGARNLAIAVRDVGGKGSAGAIITGDASVFSHSPVMLDLPIPGGSWQLAATPASGWARTSLVESIYFRIGIVNTLVLACIFSTLAIQARRIREKNAVLEGEILDRKRVEAALREEEARFRTLFDSSPDAAWIIENRVFTNCNEAAAHMLGFRSRADLLCVHPGEVSPPTQPDGERSLAKAERMMDLALQNGVHRFEWTHRRVDGTDFLAEVTLCAISLQGNPAIYCVGRDISERKLAEETLRTQQELLQAIIDSAGAIIYVFDHEGRLILCNSQFERVIGHCRQDILGKRRSEFLPEAVAAEHEGNDRVVMANNARTSFEEHNVESDGVHYYLSVKCPVIERGERRAIVGVSTDITERRKSEEQLRLAATVIATTAEGVMVTNERQEIVSVNRAFTEITGYTEAEALGRRPSMLQSERQGADFYQSMWTSLAQGDVWQGEIWNRRKSGEIFPEWLTITAIRNQVGDVCNYVGVFSDISSLKRSQSQLEHLAHFDPLTDLPNRILFQDRLTHAIERANRQEELLAVLIMDLDGFKTVNDSLGHPVGDRLLQGVASRLKACVRAEDTVARLGGDEFAVILSEPHDGRDAVGVVRKMLTSLQEPFSLSGISAMVTASVGISMYPSDGRTATDLIRNADAAMYGAKEGGRNDYRFYQSTMTDRAHEQFQQERALRRGIENHEFEVWFQPKINLASGHVTGAEALVRWRDPERGLIAPNNFIPLAERTGLIVPLGEQVLRQVVRHAREWISRDLQFGKLAVNVALTQLERSDFVAVLRACLDESGVPPRRLEIEITESLLMQNALHARETLLAIRDLGASTSIDDFGTGYSSLAYLKQLPIDNLKIDRTFIKDLPDDVNDVTITRTIIAMAHSMGFKVIAEGIETEAQRDLLRREGCDEAQGYLISKPMPAAEFERWLVGARAGMFVPGGK